MTLVRLAPGVTTKTPLTIRRGRIGDAEQLLAVYSQPGTYGGTMQLPYTALETWNERLRANDPNVILLVALADEVIVGCASLHIEPKMRRRHVAGIAIGVADTHAGQGVGSALLSELVALADNWLGLLRLELTVFVDNAAAIALYRKLGFVIEGTHRAHALRDGVLMDTHSMARLHPRPPVLPAT